VILSGPEPLCAQRQNDDSVYGKSVMNDLYLHHSMQQQDRCLATNFMVADAARVTAYLSLSVVQAYPLHAPYRIRKGMVQYP
jgi:hypothetical protein